MTDQTAPESFNARDRAKLTGELLDDLYDVLHEHGLMSTLTVAEVVGVLEILKMEIITEQSEDDSDDEEKSE